MEFTPEKYLKDYYKIWGSPLKYNIIPARNCVLEEIKYKIESEALPSIKGRLYQKFDILDNENKFNNIISKNNDYIFDLEKIYAKFVEDYAKTNSKNHKFLKFPMEKIKDEIFSISNISKIKEFKHIIEKKIHPFLQAHIYKNNQIDNFYGVENKINIHYRELMKSFNNTLSLLTTLNQALNLDDNTILFSFGQLVELYKNMLCYIENISIYLGSFLPYSIHFTLDPRDNRINKICNDFYEKVKNSNVTSLFYIIRDVDSMLEKFEIDNENFENIYRNLLETSKYEEMLKCIQRENDVDKGLKAYIENYVTYENESEYKEIFKTLKEDYFVNNLFMKEINDNLKELQKYVIYKRNIYANFISKIAVLKNNKKLKDYKLIEKNFEAECKKIEKQFETAYNYVNNLEERFNKIRTQLFKLEKYNKYTDEKDEKEFKKNLIEYKIAFEEEYEKTNNDNYDSTEAPIFENKVKNFQQFLVNNSKYLDIYKNDEKNKIINSIKNTIKNVYDKQDKPFKEKTEDKKIKYKIEYKKIKDTNIKNIKEKTEDKKFKYKIEDKKIKDMNIKNIKEKTEDKKIKYKIEDKIKK